LLRKDPRLTNAELIEITGKSQRTIMRVLAALKGKELIADNGTLKITIYNGLDYQ
jgi:predicted HTH transcriptional regulator